MKAWRLDDPLPSPSDQIDNLVFWIGDNQSTPMEWASANPLALGARLGTAILPAYDGLDWLLQGPQIEFLIERNGPTRDASIGFRLTVPGWGRYATLKAAQVNSRTAFMAMKFEDQELGEWVTKCFKPAVSRAGFELRTLIDGQPAGLIDDQLRNALRVARFVIADLTHASHGAYWETGFAEGLGRPAIYTCRQKEWDERKTQFDTNHLVTVLWSDQFEKVGQQLTATIRATLPAEANLVDL